MATYVLQGDPKLFYESLHSSLAKHTPLGIFPETNDIRYHWVGPKIYQIYTTLLVSRVEGEGLVLAEIHSHRHLRNKVKSILTKRYESQIRVKLNDHLVERLAPEARETLLQKLKP